MSSAPVRWMLGLLIVAAAVSCVEKSGAPAVQKQQLSSVKLDKAPKPQYPLEFRFGDKVRLIGYDIEQLPLVAEHPVVLTWYWKVEKPLGQGWEIFTHGSDARGHSRLNLDADRMMRSVYPVTDWKAGDYIKDRQEITLPGNWGSDSLVLFVGFYSGADRLPITLGKHDQENRAEAVRLPVRVGAEPKPLPRLVARRLGAPLVLDGKLDDREWLAAQPSGPLVNTMSGNEGAFPASVRVAYDDQNLYVGFDVEDKELIAKYEKHDDHLWEQDCVEVMVDPEGDGVNYFELQVSPRGTSFETRYDTARQPRPFGHVDWDSKIDAHVALRGTLDDGDGDQGYSVEAAIPWSAFVAGTSPASVPRPDTTWRMNFFVMNSTSDGQRAVGWSAPLIGDFHTLPRFGRVVFPVAASFKPPPVTGGAPTK